MERKDCPCRRKACARHGDCGACRAHHASLEQKYPCACEKKGSQEKPRRERAAPDSILPREVPVDKRAGNC